MDDQTRLELEAAAFRRLKQHLMEDRTDVQNIDMMNLAGFCRNCLSKWYAQAAKERGVDVDLADAQQRIYGMSYAEWKENHQTPATPEQLERYEAAQKAES